MYRKNRRLLLVGSGVTALLLVSLVGLAELNDVYYSRDPRWHDFYRYNELRARVNDLGWVCYSPQTAHVFPQVGWSVNDLGMIQAWFYDDPAVYSAEKLQELLSAIPGKSHVRRRTTCTTYMARWRRTGRLSPYWRWFH